MSWAARTEQRKDAGSADIGEYRRDRGRRDATVRSRSPATLGGPRHKSDVQARANWESTI
jgi:hypothetical protein